MPPVLSTCVYMHVDSARLRDPRTPYGERLRCTRVCAEQTSAWRLCFTSRLMPRGEAVDMFHWEHERFAPGARGHNVEIESLPDRLVRLDEQVHIGRSIYIDMRHTCTYTFKTKLFRVHLHSRHYLPDTPQNPPHAYCMYLKLYSALCGIST